MIGISVIIPVYNSEKYIRYTLDEISEWTYPNLEIIWNGNSFFDKFYKVQNFFPYAIPIVLDNEPPRM